MMPREPRTTKVPTPVTIAAGLTVSERVMLFCVASNTDWVSAGVRAVTTRALLVNGLTEREHASHYRLTPLGRAVFDALVRPTINVQDGC
jgi:hypothetical protein